MARQPSTYLLLETWPLVEQGPRANPFLEGSLLFTHLLLPIEFLSNWSQELFVFPWSGDQRCFHPNESRMLLLRGHRQEKGVRGTVGQGDRRFLQGFKKKKILLNGLIVYKNSSLMEKQKGKGSVARSLLSCADLTAYLIYQVVLCSVTFL